LDRNHKRLVENLSAYKPSSSVSLDKVKTGKVEIGGKLQSINASERDFVVKLSKRLVRTCRSCSYTLCRGRLSMQCEAAPADVTAVCIALSQDLDALEALKIFRNFMKYEATGRFEYDAEASAREVPRSCMWSAACIHPTAAAAGARIRILRL
jgi:hypothetical protein